ncbi:MAG TPA: hypothetical protein VG754_12790, partial [Verrucomicrobiae bacterium]|nr:hypothetical protein [Verrucomicrobiae bacterium]
MSGHRSIRFSGHRNFAGERADASTFLFLRGPIKTFQPARFQVNVQQRMKENDSNAGRFDRRIFLKASGMALGLAGLAS